MKKIVNLKDNKNRVSLMIFFVLCSLTTILTVIKPYVNGKFIDAITYKKDRTLIFEIAIIYAATLLLGILFSYYIKVLIVKIRNNISFQMKYKIINHYHNIPLSESLKYDAGYIYSRISQDVDYLILFFLDNLISIVSNIFVIVTSIIFLAKISYKIVICSVIFLPVYLILYLYMKKSYFMKNKKYKEEASVFSNTLLEQFSMVKEIKIRANEENIKQKLNDKYNNYFKKTLDFYSFSEKFKSFDGYLSVVFQLTTMIIGTLEIIDGNMTIGQFMVITSYFSYLLSAVKFYADFGKSFQEAKVAQQRIDEIMSIQEENDGEIIITNIHKIEILQLNFGYEKENKIINELTCEFKRNNSYCIVGMNGIGKTTFVNLIVGLYNDYSGEIVYDGVELNDINKKWLRSQECSYMLQIPKSQNLSVKEYIDYYYEKIDTLNMEDIAKKYEMYDIFYNEKFNIENYMNKKCNELSGGEWQKIRLLCTIMLESNILILDEPTSAWDEDSKEKFNGAIWLLAKDRILIIISHDGSVSRNCDCICHI